MISEYDDVQNINFDVVWSKYKEEKELKAVKEARIKAGEEAKFKAEEEERL